MEFYVDRPGFKIEWEHHFDENSPVYLEVSKGNLALHLSKHHGNGTPDAYVFVWYNDVEAYHKELIGKKNKYNRPGLEKKTCCNALAFTANDPFANKISFNENLLESKTD